MELIGFAQRFFTDLPGTLEYMSQSLGIWGYVILFLIIFCETGLVVFPFLPGDSLLFAVGAVTALPGAGLNLGLVCAVMIIAAILGDAVNYHIGSWAGRKYLSVGKIPFVRQDHLQRTQSYFAKHGGKTIIFARFIPIVRTYAPFVAGAAGMPYSRFALFNVVGALCWIGSLAPLGYFFGNQPWIRKNFELVILAIIFISILPAVIEFIRMRREAQGRARASAGDEVKLAAAPLSPTTPSRPTGEAP